MNGKLTIQKLLSLLPALAILWLVIGSLLVIQFLPDLPHSNLQWFLLIAFGPPVYIFGEAFFGWLFSAKHGESISSRKFSTVRILLALPIVLVFITLSSWVSWLLTK